jgi:hypothetical protein
MAISSHAVITADRGDVDDNERPAPLTNEEFLKVPSGTS